MSMLSPCLSRKSAKKSLQRLQARSLAKAVAGDKKKTGLQACLDSVQKLRKSVWDHVHEQLTRLISLSMHDVIAECGFAMASESFVSREVNSNGLSGGSADLEAASGQVEMYNADRITVLMKSNFQYAAINRVLEINGS